MNNIITQEELTKELIKASQAYYNTHEAIMSDFEFDQKLEKLKAMEAESGIVLPGSPTINVGAAIMGVSLKEVTHEQPALSLDKVKYKNVQKLKKWLGNKQGVVSWKMDGMTLVITFDNGILISAVTRGTGYVGEDVTANAKHIDGIPQRINYTGHLVVRGEAIMTYAEFERVNTEAGGIYENPRNLIPGTLRSGEAANRKTSFYAFELVTPEPQAQLIENNSFNLMFQGDRLNWLETLGFSIVDKEYVTSDNILEKVEEWKEDVENLKFPTDGLVISYNDMMYGMTLGNSSHHFRHSIALKWKDKTEDTTIRDVEWSVGKTGIITPVAIFEPVRLGAGSTVTKASLHNLSIMNRLNVKKGSKTEVYLANMIIPQIIECEDTAESTPLSIPCKCPICGQPTSITGRTAREVAEAYLKSQATSKYYTIVEDTYEYDNGLLLIEYASEAAMLAHEDGELRHVCVNIDDYHEETHVLHCDNAQCPARQIGGLMNSFSKDGLFVKGLGESQIEDLMQVGLVDATPLSFYTLANEDRSHSVYPKEDEFCKKVDALMAKDGWGNKKWNNLMIAIERSRNTTLQKFLYSLNIPLLGSDLSKKLSKHWGNNLDKFLKFIERNRDVKSNRKKVMRELTSIDGVGAEKAESFISWMDTVIADQEKYEDLITLIRNLEFSAPSVVTSSGSSLNGLTFVITGSVHEYKNRDEFKSSVEARGGRVTSSVSEITSFLVNNDVTSTSNKNLKAKELNIPIISEDEFISRFGK